MTNRRNEPPWFAMKAAIVLFGIAAALTVVTSTVDLVRGLGEVAKSDSAGPFIVLVFLFVVLVAVAALVAECFIDGGCEVTRRGLCYQCAGATTRYDGVQLRWECGACYLERRPAHYLRERVGPGGTT